MQCCMVQTGETQYGMILSGMRRSSMMQSGSIIQETVKVVVYKMTNLCEPNLNTFRDQAILAPFYQVFDLRFS